MILVDRMALHSDSFRLENISLTVPTGQYGMLMGRTGCGKTTILESIIGLRRIRSGRILLCGRDVTRLNPAARGVGYVPQDGALFAGMSVRDHLAFALVIRSVSRRQISRRVDELAELLGISGLLDRTPTGLSGGERQRVALGRALSFRPQVLCLDEPLSALDAQTRGQMCDLLKSVTRQSGVTTLHVTHNPEEAGILGDCHLRMTDGTVHVMSEYDQPVLRDQEG